MGSGLCYEDQLEGQRVRKLLLRGLFGLLRFGLFVSFCFGPAFFDYLAGAAKGQGIWRDVFCDCRRGGHVRAFSDPNRGDEDAVAAYEDSVFDDSFVFAYTVVVAGDGAGAYVYFLSDFSVSQIREVICFGSLAQAGFLQFGEISYVSFFTDFESS